MSCRSVSYLNNNPRTFEAHYRRSVSIREEDVMKSMVLILVLASLLAIPVAALAQPTCPPGGGETDLNMWIDTDGDGAPGPNQTVALNASVTVDVYIDTESFAFTSFQAWVDLGDGGGFYFSRDTADVDVTFRITGGVPDVVDTFSNPTAIGFTGSGYLSQMGVIRVATLVTKAIRNAPSFSGCIAPIVDYANPSGTFSIVSAATYAVFCTGVVTSGCYTIGGGNSTENTTWGGVKSLFQ